MSPSIHQRPPEPLSVVFADMKRAGARLLEAYVDAGTDEMLGASRRVVLAKFTLVALSAFAIGLSLYGLIFEAAHLGFTRYWTGATPEMSRMATHATMALAFGAIALLMTTRKKALNTPK